MSEKNQLENDIEVVPVKPDVEEPRHYEVVLHNDDYTTMEFVIEVLERFFHKNAEEAKSIMLNIHEKGSGIAGIYPREIAEMKVEQVIGYAKAHQFPLLTTLRPH